MTLAFLLLIPLVLVLKRTTGSLAVRSVTEHQVAGGAGSSLRTLLQLGADLYAAAISYERRRAAWS